eukprot:473733-Prymnesium_polylepis.1
MAPAGPGSPDTTTLISNIDGETGPKSTVWISTRRRTLTHNVACTISGPLDRLSQHGAARK